MAINKVVYNGNTLIDLTGDTVTPAQLLNGVTAHDKTGSPITGTFSFSTETKTVTPTASQQTVTPTNADALSEVIVNAIPYVETVNTYGTTVTIG